VTAVTENSSSILLYKSKILKGLIIDLEIIHRNIANLSTTSRETVTRFLSKAAKADEIEVLASKQILLKNFFSN
jgi:CRP-like cAMP-binding protein